MTQDTTTGTTKAHHPVRLFGMATLVFVVVALMFALSVFECLDADQQGRGCMQFLENPMARMGMWFWYPRDNTRLFLRQIFAGVGLLVAIIMLWSLVRRRITSVRVSLALVVALLGEYFILQRETQYGIIATLLTPIVIAIISLGFPPTDSEQTPYAARIKTPEFLGVVLLSALLLTTQFFLLNWIPYGWDTEFCPYRHLYWQEWSGIMLHESGYSPQTSLGPAWHVLMKMIGHVNEPDKYYLYIRFLSSAVATLKFLVLFFFVRWLSGTFAAFLSIALLGFGPPENWWSRETNIHQLPGLMAIPLFWAWIAVWQRPTWTRFTMLAGAMGLMRFVYPSGMFLAFGPLIFFPVLVVFQRRQWLRHVPKMLVLLVGIAFWLLWRSLARWLYNGRWELVHPLEVPGSYASRGLGMRLSELFANCIDAFNSTFVYQVNPTHWTFALTLSPERCTTSIAVVLTLLMLGRILRFRANAVDFLMLISLGLSFVPGLLSEVAARRTGVSFLILTIIAAREASYLTGLLKRDGNRFIAWTIRLFLPMVAGLYLMWISSSIHFAGKGGEPHQITRGRMIREEIQDDALIVYLTGSLNCDIFYSLYSDLASRDCRTGYAIPEYEGSKDTQTLIDNPSILDSNWVYRQTGMKKCLDAHKDKEWRKIIYFVPEPERSQKLIELLKAKYPGAPHREKTAPTPRWGTYRIFILTVER
jgi:hypothetical protein